MSLMCYQASVPGTSHLALGIPNQDSFAVHIVRSGWSSTCVAPGGTRVRRVRGDEFVVAAVADGRIAESDIDAHVLRILRYKQAQGWIE